MNKIGPGKRIKQHTWVTVGYPSTRELAKGLEMTPEKVVWQLWNVCVLPAAQVSQP